MRIPRAQSVPSNGLPRVLRSMVGEVCEGCGGGELSWHRCGRFFSTAAMASGVVEQSQRSRKRLSKRERKTMVESFVNRYRTLNAGKFPTASVTQKEVGGSFYVIREILQELEYKLVHNPVVEITGNSLIEKRGEENEIMTEPELTWAVQDSCSHSPVDRELERDLLEVEKVPSAKGNICTKGIQVLADKVETEFEESVDAETERESIKVKEVYSQPMSRDLAGMTGDVSTDQQSACEEPERVSFAEHANHFTSDDAKKYSENRKVLEMVNSSEKTLLEDALKSRSKEDKDELLKTSRCPQAEGSSSVPHTGEPVSVDEMDVNSSQGFVRSEISTSKLINDQSSPGFDESREASMKTADHNDLQEKPSLWSNLKSFAGSIFGIWRKK